MIHFSRREINQGVAPVAKNQQKRRASCRPSFVPQLGFLADNVLQINWLLLCLRLRFSLWRLQLEHPLQGLPLRLVVPEHLQQLVQVLRQEP
jgi:hypothetical protein